ncbi:hypothetical protein [Sphingomonas profundi]|uniref:hypothetical protein n=1 Tax=Alterirhizorhabdus profundi TaxID=2681549 RepID=UPI001E55EEBF|nr:hypothetical protein [Sphingomonas profundi]
MPRARRGAAFPAWPPALAVALLYAAQIAAFRWGVITPDTVFQWGQALSGRYDDWHPPATAWAWRQLMPLGPGTAPVLLAQCALYWAAAWLIADTLRRRGDGWAAAAVLLVAAAPIPFGQMGAILKDPLLAACCLLAAALILARPRAAVPLAVGLLVFASATRINAPFATAPLLVALLPPRWTDRPARLAAALVLSAALLFAAGALINRVMLRPHRAQPIFSLLNFDLAGIVAHGDATAYPNLAPAVAARVTARCYDPAQYNPGFGETCDRVEDALFAHAAAQARSPAAIWIGAVAAAPGAWARHRLAHFNRNMRLFVPAVPDDAVYIMSEPNPFGLRFVPNAATLLVRRAAMGLATSPLGRPATWLAVALGLLLAAGASTTRLPSRRFVLGLAASAAGYGGAYAMISVAPDLRYNLWTMLAAAMALAVALGEWARDPACRPSRGRAALALAPAALAVAAELAGLAIG